MDKVGANFSEEFVFMDVGYKGVTMESVLETQVASSTTFDFEAVEKTTIKGHVEVLEGEELAI